MTDYKGLIDRLWQQSSVKGNAPIESTLKSAAIAIEELVEKTRWIPVSERLPDNKKGERRVFATIRDKYYRERMIAVLRYNAYRDDWRIDGIEGAWLSTWLNGYFKVVAWQPLPEPYKGEE